MDPTRSEGQEKIDFGRYTEAELIRKPIRNLAVSKIHALWAQYVIRLTAELLPPLVVNKVYAIRDLPAKTRSDLMTVVFLSALLQQSDGGRLMYGQINLIALDPLGVTVDMSGDLLEVGKYMPGFVGFGTGTSEVR